MRFVFSCLAGLVLGLAPPAFSAHAATLAKEPALQENFYGVHILDSRVWVVGYYGTILHSNDRGLTWKIQRSPTRSSLFRVRFLSGEKGWISGSYGTLLYTADGGTNWSAQPTGTIEQLFGLTSVNEHTGWAVGSRGTILHTQDGGRSWINSSLSEDLTFSDVAFVNASRGWIVGEFGVIFQTRNGGKSWDKQKSPVEVSFVSGESRNLFALLFPEPENGWAFGLDGVVLKTRGGSRWEIVRQKKAGDSSPGANHLFAAAAINGRLWAVGERGTLLHSDADGSSWRQATAETPPVSLNGIAFGKDGFGLIVGNRGVILRTEDGGTTWKRLKITLQGQGKQLNPMRRLATFIVQKRAAILWIILLATLFFSYHALKIQMYTAFSDLLPRDHPYIRVHNEFWKTFGGANVILISVEAADGDIFNQAALEKVKKLTEIIERIPGVNNYQIFSIARQKVKDVRATAWGIEVQPVMWPDVPRSPAAIERLRNIVYANPTIIGRLVSEDGKAALITAAFHEERLDYAALFQRIQQAIKEVEDDKTRVFAAGEPILYGWIYHYLREIGLIIALTCFSILALLVLYYRNLNGVLIPALSALVTFIWGTGFTALLGYNFEPLILVVPFLIAARTISHSIQFRERFFEELERFGDKEKAAIESAAGLMMPASVSIITDAVGLTVLLVAPMPILTKLAIAGSFWVLTNLVTVVILDPILCCYFPAPRHLPKGGEGHWLEMPLRSLGGFCVHRLGRVLVTACFVGIVAWSLYWYQFLTVGDSRPGSPLLWPDSNYNQSVRHINEKFQGTDHLYVIVKGEKENTMKSPQVLETIEAFQRHMLRSPHVGGTDSLVDLTRQINTVLHNSDPRWSLLPRSADDVGGIVMVAEHGSEPGDFDRWVNYNFQHGRVTFFLYDHKGDTLREVIDRATEFIQSHPLQGAEFKLASGYAGVLAAANEVIARSDKLTLGLMLLAQLVFCAIGFRSLVAGLFFVGVVLLSNTFGMALMAYWNVGLNVNTLPVISLGIGFGEDYGIYIVSRIIEEYHRQNHTDLPSAVIEGIATAGKAVLYTAVLVSAGIAFWSLSPLRFQAEMGYQLLIILTMNMLGGLLLLPALIALLKPKFVLGEGR